MIVFDASVLANVVGDDGPVGQLTRDVLAAEGEVSIPDLADVETVVVLRKRWLAACGAASTPRGPPHLGTLGTPHALGG